MCLVSNFVIYLYIFYKEQLGWTLHTSWKRCARDFCKCEECMESISIPPGPILGCVGGGWPRLGRPYGSRRSAHPSVRPSALTTACTQHTIPIVACLTGNRSIVWLLGTTLLGSWRSCGALSVACGRSVWRVWCVARAWRVCCSICAALDAARRWWTWQRWRLQSSRARSSVKDDKDGHLVYWPGYVMGARCSCPHHTLIVCIS